MCIAVMLVLAVLPARAASSPPDPEIAALIKRVEQSDGVVFIRNGNEYPAAKAASHLRRKLRAAHGRVHTAEQFIGHLATRSSFSGRSYRVRLRDGREMDSAPWLYGLLRDLRAQRRAIRTLPSSG